MPWNPVHAGDRRETKKDGTNDLPRILGWTIEEERENFGTILTVTNQDSTVPIRVELPDVVDDGDLASSIWPSSLASAILCGQGFLRSSLSDKNVLELGSGMGAFGLTVANYAASVHLTDRHEPAVHSLQELLAEKNDSLNCIRQASVLEWRDEHTTTKHQFDVVLGSDVAYYYFLLRPLMDTILSQRKPQESLVCVVGPANRESMWDLYNNISNGCYNQLTDVHEPAWEGESKMLLYRLEMGSWVEDEMEPKIEGEVPIAVLLHTTPGHATLPLTAWDYVATDKDLEALEMSF